MAPWLEKYTLLAFDEIGSTNDEAKNIIISTAASNVVVWARAQTRGRGRYGRSWDSGEGNLYMSIVIKVSCDLNKASQLSFVAALAAYDSLKATTKEQKLSNSFFLKWPNDIMLGDLKLGGILLESVTHKNELYIIIGIGINIEHLPLGIGGATALKSHNIEVPIPYLMNKIVSKFEVYRSAWTMSGFKDIRSEWLKYAYKLGKIVTVGSANKRASGVFESIDDEGGIVLQLASGERYVLSTGEVFFE